MDDASSSETSDSWKTLGDKHIATKFQFLTGVSTYHYLITLHSLVCDTPYLKFFEHLRPFLFVWLIPLFAF
jgi:hypothetical protein